MLYTLVVLLRGELAKSKGAVERNYNFVKTYSLQGEYELTVKSSPPPLLSGGVGGECLEATRGVACAEGMPLPRDFFLILKMQHFMHVMLC